MPYVRNGTMVNDDGSYVAPGINSNLSNQNVNSTIGLGSTNKSQYGYTENGLAYLANNSDSYINAYNQEKAWLRDDLIRKEGYAREDSAYTRLFNELKSLGVNPALVLGSASSTTGASNHNSASSFKTSDYDANSKTLLANGAKVAGAIIAAIAMVVAAFA